MCYRMKSRFGAWAVVVGLLLAIAAGAVPTVNLELVAVPVPGPVTVDGRLEDWDLSGSILCCPDTDVLLAVAAVRAAAIYDAQGLYLACRWVDPTPLANRVDPDEPGMFNQGWRSDCLQLRLFTDRQIHVTAWQYQANGKMMMDLNYDQPVGPNRLNGLEHGAKMAFAKNADGQGYVQELFLPWALLSRAGKVFTAGESFTFGCHFNWGGKDNKSWRETEWQDPVCGPAVNRPFFWNDQSAWGKLRLSPVGKLSLPPQPWDRATTGPDLSTVGILELRYDLPAAGRVTLVVDDANGRRVRNLISAYPRAGGPQVDWWDGGDDLGKPVKPGDYRWRGLFNPGVNVRYRLHLFPHTNPPWRNAEGTGGWGADHSAPSWVAVSGDRVYLLYPGAEGGSALLACDLQGNRRWGHGGALQGGGDVCTTDGKDLYYANEKVLTRVDCATGKALAFGSGAKSVALDFGGQHPTGLAVRGGRLYVAAAKAGLIRVFDLVTDRAVQELKVAAPGGLAFAADGRLLVASGEQVVAVALDTGQCTPVIADGLKTPRGLTIGRDGAIYVVNGGTHQVLVYSADGTRRVREIGVAGGRPPVGPWQRNGMLNPTAVGLDRDGNCWVSENDAAAKRLSKWGPNGQCLGEWLGPSPYGGDGVVDHADRSRVYCGALEFKADWATGAASPVYQHLRGVEAGQPASAGLIAHGSFWHRQGFTMTYRGHDYFCFDRGLVCIKRGPAWVPAAAIGYVKGEDQLLWSDRNDDGRVQDDEVVKLAGVPGGGFHLAGGGGWGVPWSRHDLSTVRMTAKGGTVIRFTPAEITPTGVPVFDQRSVSTVALPVWGGNGGPVDVDDDLMIAYYEDSHAPGVQQLKDHALGDMRGIKAYDRRAQLRWTYPQPFSGVHGSFKAPLPRLPGDVCGTIYVMGVADLEPAIGRIVCFNGYYGQRFLFTTDGLFVQELFKDSRMMPVTPATATRDLLMNDMGPGTEAYAGTFSRNANGEVYLTGGFSGPMCVVMGVEGLDRMQRLAGGTLSVTAAQIEQGLAKRRQREAGAAAGGAPKVLAMVRGTRTVDGKLEDWQLDAQGVELKPDARRTARVALAHDDRNLYLAFRVQDNSPWRNAGNDEKVMFLYGDSVDVQLGLDPQADPRRVGAVAGDLRLAIAPQAGRPVVMLYQPVVPGFAGAKVPFVSPVGRVEMDRVERLDAASVAVVTGLDHYVVEAAIPLAALGRPLPVGKTIRGDVGVLYSDDLGTDCILRAYWSNRDTNLTADLPSEARLQPKEWGEVKVE